MDSEGTSFHPKPFESLLEQWGGLCCFPLHGRRAFHVTQKQTDWARCGSSSSIDVGREHAGILKGILSAGQAALSFFSALLLQSLLLIPLDTLWNTLVTGSIVAVYVSRAFCSTGLLRCPQQRTVRQPACCRLKEQILQQQTNEEIDIFSAVQPLHLAKKQGLGRKNISGFMQLRGRFPMHDICLEAKKHRPNHYCRTLRFLNQDCGWHTTLPV